jgi:hypothetical protein
MSRNKVAVFAIAVAISCLLAQPSMSLAADGACVSLAEAKREQLVAYLKGERPTLDPACVLYALDRLADDHTAADASVLVTLLDFPKPEAGGALGQDGLPPLGSKTPRQVGGSTDVMPWVGRQYPAAKVLFRIGASADADLIRVIGNVESSDLLRSNAVEVLRLIHREDLSLSANTLAAAARASFETDRPRSERLLHAARRLAQDCIDMTQLYVGNPAADAMRSRCEGALK